jgi:hypothetical protein
MIRDLRPGSTARVVNPGLREALEPEAIQRCNASRGKPAGFLPDKVTTYLEGEYRLRGGVKVSGPLRETASRQRADSIDCPRYPTTGPGHSLP